MIAISSYVHEGIPVRGEFEHHILGYYNRYIGRSTEYHFLSVHHMTHIEAPLSQLFENRVKTDIYDTPKALDAIVINIDLADKCLRILEDSLYGKLLKSGVSTHDFLQVLSDLAITKAMVRSQLQSVLGKSRISADDIRNKFLFIRTGWQERYQPNQEVEYNLGNPLFECFHPYLIHPYISSESEEDVIKYILDDLGCTGLALESPGVDHPLTFVTAEDCFPSVGRVLRDAERIGVKLNKHEVSRSINQCILERLKEKKPVFYFIRNIDFRKLPNANTGYIQIYPFKLLTDDWGIACEVFFDEGKPMSPIMDTAILNDAKGRSLSRTSYEICARRGFMRPEKLSLLEGEIHKGGYTPTIHFVPTHSTTHFDIYYDRSLDEIANLFSKPIELEALVMDVSSRIHEIEEYVTHSAIPFGLPIPVLRKGIVEDGEVMLRILDILEIGKEEIANCFRNEETDGKFLFINTGWDIFKPNFANLNNRLWELYHAYLCHPYVSLDAARYIAEEKGFCGIGTDAPLLENPIIYLTEQSNLKEKKIGRKPAIDTILNSEKHKQYLDIMDYKGQVPCRKLFHEINKKFLYVKNLRSVSDVFQEMCADNEKPLHLKLVICPLISILPRRNDEIQCLLNKESPVIIGLPSEVFVYI